MKRFVILLALLLVMGCGKQDSAEPETRSAPTTGGQGASSAVEPQPPEPAQEVVKEPTLAGKVVGSYTHVTKKFTIN